ncbi:hypothetical protein Poly30_11330 [Planctomycetes bacterium Poly30]|uniref:Uncharacterized protein n=1 Tax=Saltatorellus ferox TaxID=2528018 RepID=A0A518ENH9_9BACT|nr:hypothetical protein Poly30_11330 [Planctomycetes bacterium Poly30]
MTQDHEEVNSAREKRMGITEAELLGLFERRRPDAEAFRRRIADRTANGDAPTSSATHEAAPFTRSESPRPWTRAAALLPAHLSGVKLIPAALVWPLLVLAAALGGFVFGKRSLQKSMDIDRQSERSSGEDRSGFLLTALSLGMHFLILVALAVGGVRVTDAILVVLLVGMFSFVWVVRVSARAGRVTRAEVAQQALTLLDALLMGGAFWFLTPLGGASLEKLHATWTIVPLAAGIIAIHAITGQRGRIGSMLVWIVLIALFWNPLGITNSSPDSLREQGERYELDVHDLARWKEAAAISTALADVDERPVHPSFRVPLEREVAHAVREPDGVHPVVWMSADAMGLIGPNEWAQLALHQSERLESLKDHIQRTIEGEEPQGISRTIYQQFDVLMLLATEELDGSAREALARMVLANWPNSGEHGALQQAVACLRLLERLDRLDLIEGRRQAARQLVADHWIANARPFRFARVGGFSPDPAKFRTSFDDSTLAGVLLMARFGVPDSVDLYLLRGYLRYSTRAFGRIGRREPLAYLHGLGRAALMRLDRQIGLPPRTWFERLMDLRMILVVLLVVGLCLTAIRIAPPDPLSSGNGALP